MPNSNPHADAGELQPTIDFPADYESSVSINRFGETVIGALTEPTDQPGGSSQDSAPQKLGKYELREVIGRGAFGAVYRGHDPQLDRDVAIKVPHLQKSQGPAGSKKKEDDGSRESTRKIVREFLQEARQLAALKHPGIVTVLDVDVADDNCLIVSEFLDGPNLNQWMVGRAVPWPETTQIVSEIADALAYAHSQSTVHRDLKPGNIILVERADGLRPILVDFGLALSEGVAGRSQLGVIAGTPNYMSPEQARGEGHRIDGRTDIYALGVILYRMLCGSLPFAAPSVMQLLAKVLKEDPVPPRQLNRGIPKELEKVCLKAMSKDIADRHTTAGDLAAELREVLRKHTDKQTGGPAESERSREAVRRQVTVLCCAAGTTSWTQLSSSRNSNRNSSTTCWSSFKISAKKRCARTTAASCRFPVTACSCASVIRQPTRTRHAAPPAADWDCSNGFRNFRLGWRRSTASPSRRRPAFTPAAWSFRSTSANRSAKCC